MVQDKLSREQRVRLEALAQAVASHCRLAPAPTPNAAATATIATAKTFEAYVAGESQLVLAMQELFAFLAELEVPPVVLVDQLLESEQRKVDHERTERLVALIDRLAKVAAVDEDDPTGFEVLG